MEHTYFNLYLDILQNMVVEDLNRELRRRRQKKKWVRKWIARRELMGASVTLMRELEHSYMNVIRITPNKFEELLACIKKDIQRKDTIMRNAVPAKLKLELTLRFLATGDSLRSLSYLFRIPVCTISLFLPEVLETISKSLSNFLQVNFLLKNQITNL